MRHAERDDYLPSGMLLFNAADRAPRGRGTACTAAVVGGDRTSSNGFMRKKPWKSVRLWQKSRIFPHNSIDKPRLLFYLCVLTWVFACCFTHFCGERGNCEWPTNRTNPSLRPRLR